MSIIISYLTGGCSGQEFICAARSNPDIAKWFQDILPPGADILDIPYIPYQFIEPGQECYQSAGSTHTFWADVHTNDCLNCLHDRISFQEYFHMTSDFDTAGGRVNAYGFLFSLAKKRLPNLVPSSRFSDEYGFYLDTCGESFDGPEVEQYLDNLIYDIYTQSGTKTSKKQRAKRTLAEAFHIEGRTYPRWIQGPEWPMGQHSPMEYLSRKRDGDRVVFIFRDVDTGEIREVEQFY